MNVHPLTVHFFEILTIAKPPPEKAPPEIAADVAEKGMVLSGGTSMIRNFDKLITQRTGMKVTIADSPLEGVVNGASKALEKPDRLETYIKKLRR